MYLFWGKNSYWRCFLSQVALLHTYLFCSTICIAYLPTLFWKYSSLYLEVSNIVLDTISLPHTGKPLSEALILASTNPQYDDRLFIELQAQYMKIPNSEDVVYTNWFFVLTFRTIYVHNMFSWRSELVVFMYSSQARLWLSKLGVDTSIGWA